jgi:hypothetical protein
MKLTHQQENIVKSTAEAISNWRDGLGSAAWVILGLVLLVALLAAGTALIFIVRGRCTRAQAPPAVRGP